MPTIIEKVEPGRFYHICDRAIGKDILFNCHSDYEVFLNKVEKYILTVAELHAYCLMENHYHLITRSFLSTTPDLFSAQIRLLHSTYAKDYYNKKYDRKGGLFMSPFNRIGFKDDAHSAWAFWYVHRNPMHHGLTLDWRSYEYSSYKNYITNQTGILTTNFFLEFFGGLDPLIKYHELNEQNFLVDFRKYGLEFPHPAGSHPAGVYGAEPPRGMESDFQSSPRIVLPR